MCIRDRLIAYYHWLSFRAYGPSVIMRENIDPLTPIEELPERSSVDEVVQFIDEKITEAETIGLAEKHDVDDYGRFTKYVAEALRAKVHLLSLIHISANTIRIEKRDNNQ